MTEQSVNPVLVEVCRGGVVESTHRGSVVVVDTAGDVVYSRGDYESSVFPRSALKLIQSIPLVESGAAKQFRLSQVEIALACASHNGEVVHTRAISRWLQRLGLDTNALECGASLPSLEQAAHELLARGEKPGKIHQQCSGKHTGMLTLSKFMEVPTRGYSHYDHPSQQRWMTVLGELTGLDVGALKWDRDGCGMPALCMPMESLARAYAWFANTAELEQRRGDAMAYIIESVKAYPRMIAGSNRCCSEVIQDTRGKVIVKTGAEGVYVGVVPHRSFGFALKIDDGATRASEVALGALLNRLNVLDSAERNKLAIRFQPQVTNSQGKVTGVVRPCGDW